MDNDGSSALAIIEQPRTLLIPTEQTSNSAMALAKLAAASGLCKTRVVADAFFIIMYGYELGIPAMTALRTINTIKGTPVCSGEAMLALIRRSRKVEIKITGNATEATVYMKRKETGEEYIARWDIVRATTAGLMGNDNWKKFPQAMMQWRGVSEGGKFLCSDIIGGLYTFEEIAPDAPVDENGEPIIITIPKWHEDEDNLRQLSERAFTAGLIKERNGKGVAEMEAMIAPKTWNDFADRQSAGQAIKEIAEARKAAAQPAPEPPAVPDQSPDAMPEVAGKPAPDYPFSSVDEERAALAKIAAESNGTPVATTPDSPFMNAGKFQKPLDGMRALNSAERKAAERDLEA